ncbi:hypothetical protein, partial [Halobacteriovorax sp.]|uniref:hypothetical protein n=1 Tax=Halobacteriovorax sp. TaxID=2020862 RepID=UPI00356286B7
MTKKKFNLHEKLKSITKETSESSFEEQALGVFPPIIEESTKFDFNYSVADVTPPTFDKQEFKKSKTKDHISEKIRVESLEEQVVSTNHSEIKALKKLRKKDYDALSQSKKEVEELDNIKFDLEEKHNYEKEKNIASRNSLKKVREEISEKSREVDSLTNEKSNLHIENLSLEKEYNKLIEKRDESKNKISELTKENGVLTESLANIHRDKNEIEEVYRVNIDLIKKYEKQIVVNKENINGLLRDIDLKNKEVDKKSKTIELLKEDLEDARALEAKISADYEQLKVELINSEKSLSDLKSKKETLLQEINILKAALNE